MPSESRVLEFIFFDAGGGHRNAAMALKSVIAERYPGWRIELINLQEILGPVDMFQKVTGLQSQDFYNAILKRGWTFGSLAMLRTLQRGIRFYTPAFEDVLEKHWRTSKPDLVVSLIPNFNGIMYRALRRVHADLPYVTVMTDLADFPPGFWLEHQNQSIICGTDHAVAQAEAEGYPAERIFRTSGMILKPQFYREPAGDRRAARAALGIDPDLPTALVMFGGYGSKTAARIVERLEKSDLKLQTIVLCGHNETLRTSLAGKPNCHAVGFTDTVPDYMRLADFFIGKPGPGSISEALHMGLPVILERNTLTMPQEKYNTVWVEEQHLGIVMRSFKQIAEAVGTLLQDGRLEEFRRNAARLNNRAVYEIPEIFERIMAEMPETATHSAAGFQGLGAVYPSEREAIVALVDLLRLEESAAGVAIGGWVKVCKDPSLRGGLGMIAERESFHGRFFGRRMTALGAPWGPEIPPERDAEYQACLANPKVADTVKLARLAAAIGDSVAVIAPVIDFANRITEDLETREALRLYCEDELSTGRWVDEACRRLGLGPVA